MSPYVRKDPGRTLTERELAAKRAAAKRAQEANRKPPELRKSERVRLTPGEWAMVLEQRARVARSGG